MAVDFGKAVTWIEAHPIESVAIGGGSVLVLMWLLGFFGHGSSGASAGASNLAGAYYAAEAQQAVVGGQIQQATIATAAQTAQTQLNDNAAVAINSAQAHAAVAINGQNTNSAATINQAQVDSATQIALAQSSDQLQATYSNNATLLADTQSNNATAAAVNASNNQTSLYQTILGSIIPQELSTSLTAKSASQISIPGIGIIGATATTPFVWGLNDLASAGYNPAQIKQLTGF